MQLGFCPAQELGEVVPTTSAALGTKPRRGAHIGQHRALSPRHLTPGPCTPFVIPIPSTPQQTLPCSSSSPREDQARSVPACLVAFTGWPGPSLCQKDHFRERFCSGFVISAVTWQSTLAGTRGCSAPVTPCPTLSLPLASNPAWSKHLRSPDLQPSLGTNLFLSGKNSSWAFYHIDRPCFCPQDSGSSVTPAAFNFQGNSVLSKKQSQHPSHCRLPVASCIRAAILLISC